MLAFDALPKFCERVQRALENIGRGDLGQQLAQAEIDDWSYDTSIDAAYVYLKTQSGTMQKLNEHCETVPVPDDCYLINVDVNAAGSLSGIEVVSGGGDIAAKLRDLSAL